MKKILKGETAPLEGILLTEEEYSQLYTKQEVIDIAHEVGEEIKKTLKQVFHDDTDFKTKQNNSPDIVEW